MNALEPTLDNNSQIDFNSPSTDDQSSINYNNYRFKEGDKISEQAKVAEKGYLQEKTTLINTDGPVFMKGWAKFLHLDPKIPSKKLKFFLNMDWHEH